MPNLEFENKYDGLVCGVDEVGRGPWAGPVVTCAVALKASLPEHILQELDDSKKLTDKKRQALFEPLKYYFHYSIAEATVKEIDELNILKATMIAMKRAVENLNESLDNKLVHALIDGNKEPDLNIPQTTIIKGDSQSISIAAASVIAKVSRDLLMQKLAKEFPYYGWERNAGYGTKAHIQGIKDYGICEHHRTSFAPIKNAMENIQTENYHKDY
ncbi:MAG: ribonuclease HII [Alphaproteobacteria bacterium]